MFKDLSNEIINGTTTLISTINDEKARHILGNII